MRSAVSTAPQAWHTQAQSEEALPLAHRKKKGAAEQILRRPCAWEEARDGWRGCRRGGRLRPHVLLRARQHYGYGGPSTVGWQGRANGKKVVVGGGGRPCAVKI